MRSAVLVVAAAAAAAAAGVRAYDCKVCYTDMCCNIPSDHQYYLTDFCGSPGTMACGLTCADGDRRFKYYTADRQRFGCGKTLKICGRGKCVSASVQDAGPNKFVEEDAGRAVIDSSIATCRHFTGGSSCGWSDRISVTAVVSDAPHVGPIRVTHEEYRDFVGNATYAAEIEAGYIDPAKPLPWDDSVDHTQAPTSAAAPCCAPAQFTTYSFSWDEREHWRAGVNTTFDFTNERLAVYIAEHKNQQAVTLLAEIVDFKTKTATTVDFTAKKCHKTQVKHDMVKDCVPADAQLEESYKVAGQMPASLYKFHIDTAVVYEQRATQNCAVFQSAAVDERFGVAVTDHFFWDAGIADPSVFTPPSFCSTDSHSHPEIVSPVSHLLHTTADMTRLRAALPALMKKN